MTKLRVARGVLWAAWVAFLVVAGFSHPASAQAAPAAPDTGLLGVIQTMFTAAMAPMATAAATWSAVIFYGLIALEAMIVLYRGLWLSDWSELTENLVSFVVLYGIGTWIITNQVTNGLWAVTEINTIASSFAGSATPVTPDSIVSTGYKTATALIAAMPSDPVAGALLVIPKYFAGLIVMVSFMIIAADDLLIQMIVQLCANIAAIMLAGVACRYTRGYAAMYPKLLVTSLLLLITVNAVAGLGVGVSDFMISAISKATVSDPLGWVGGAVTVSASAVVYGVFAFGIVALAGFLSASSPMTSAATVRRMVGSAASAFGGRGGGSGSGGASDGGSVASIEKAKRFG